MLAEADWEMLGAVAGIAAVVLFVVGAAINWYRGNRRDRAAEAPRIEFSDIYFAGPGEHPRTAYRYAFGVRLTNTGPGVARHVQWAYLDEEGEWFAEVVHRVALAPGESTEDWSGVRGEDQSHDPTEDEARAFYDRCTLSAVCWDSRDRSHVFFPFGGGRPPWWLRTWIGLRRRGALPKRSFEMREELSQFPSRGETRRSLGAGTATPAGAFDAEGLSSGSVHGRVASHAGAVAAAASGLVMMAKDASLPLTVSVLAFAVLVAISTELRRRGAGWRTAALVVVAGTCASLGLTAWLDGDLSADDPSQHSARGQGAQSPADELVFELKRRFHWASPPTIHQPSATYLRAHFEQYDPERLHRSTEYTVATDVPTLGFEAPRFVGVPIKVSGRLVQPPQLVEVLDGGGSWAFVIQDRRAPSMAVMCRVPLRAGEEKGFSVGDRVQAYGLFVADGDIDRLDGKGPGRILYLLGTGITRTAFKLTIGPKGIVVRDP